MDQAASNIVLGVVSGVITAVVLFGVSRFWRDTLLPMLKHWKYQGVDVAGTWTGTDKGTSSTGSWDTELTLNLVQSTLLVSGQFFIRYRSSDDSYDLLHLVSGRIWEGYVSLTLVPENRQATQVATALLKISKGGTQLIGMLLIRDGTTDTVKGHDFFMERKSIAKGVSTASAIKVPPPATTPPTP